MDVFQEFCQGGRDDFISNYVFVLPFYRECLLLLLLLRFSAEGAVVAVIIVCCGGVAQ